MAKQHSNCSRKYCLYEASHGISFLFVLFFFSQLLFMASAQSGINHPAPGFNPDHLQTPFNRSMAILMIVVVSVFFCFGCVCVYIRQCTERGIFDPSALAEHGGGYLQSPPQRGIDPTIIKKFPTFQYSSVKGLKIGKRALECAVCLNEFEGHETLRLLPQCNHVFHTQCVDSWLSGHTTCPVCRANLVPKPGESSYKLPSMAAEPESRHSDSDNTENQANQASVVVNVSDHDQERPNLGILPTCSPMPWSSGLRFNRLFTRSHSTGHSLVQPGGDHERFTLRLPEDVRNQLLNTGLKRTKSCEDLFPAMKSQRKGFLSRSAGNSFNYERFHRDWRAERWGFSMTPPFITKAGSTKSQKGACV